MRTFIGAAAFGLGATAAVLPRQDGCCFQLTASGGESGVLSQLSDGQNRIMNGNGGADSGAATYCINNGALTDGSGRGCILTAPTTQFQCDTGATPQPGFSVNGNGMLEYGSDTTFYACAATDSSYNIYTNTSSAQTGCSKITLSTGGKCENTNMGASAATSTQTLTQYDTATVVSVSASASPTTATEYNTNTVVSVSASPSPTTATEYSTNTVVSVSASPSPTTATEYNTNTVVSISASPYPTTDYNTNTVVYTKTDTVVSVSASAYASPTTETQYKTVVSTQVVPTTVYSTVVSTNQVTVTQTPAYCSSLAASVSSLQATCYTQQATVTETPAYCSSLAASVSSLQSQTAPATVTVTAPAYSSGKASSTAPAASNTYPATGTQSTGYGGASASACQTSLTGAYQTPHLIVPVSSESPDDAYGTSYFGQVNSTTSSIFNFDIPQSYEGMQCSIIFMLPAKSDLSTADYTLSSGGSIEFSELSSAATQKTTWNTVPKVAEHLNSIAVTPGSTYVVATQACAAGMVESIELSSENGLALSFFEDYNPAPLGLYITAC